MRPRPLRLVFLGCGQATDTHSRTLRKLDPAVERFFASRDPARARERAERHGGADAFGSYEAALADPRPDAAVVATPPDSHRALAEAALRAGKHVVVEKPPFLDTSDFDAVAALATRTGRRVLVAENYFYKPLAGALRRLLAEGAVGEPRLVLVNAVKRQAVEGWRDDPERAGGGALFEGGIHWVALLGSLGLEVRRAWASMAPRSGRNDRSALLALEYAGGAAASLAYSWEVPSPLRGLRLSRIHGTGGTVFFESNGLFALAWGERKRLVLPGLRDIAGYRAMWADFLRVLRDGGEPALCLDRARRDLELVEAAYRSAAEARAGRP